MVDIEVTGLGCDSAVRRLREEDLTACQKEERKEKKRIKKRKRTTI